MASLISYDSLFVPLISVSEVMKNRQGNNTAFLNFNNKKITMMTPQLYVPFGLSTYETENGSKDSINVSFIDSEENSETKAFYNKLKELDEFMIETAYKNSTKWFGKSLPREVIMEFYRPLVKPGKRKPNSDENYPEMAKLKIRNKDEIQAYDTEKNRISISDIETKSRIRSIVEISPLWFINKTFGVTLNLVQVEIKNSEKFQVSLLKLKLYGFN